MPDRQLERCEAVRQELGEHRSGDGGRLGVEDLIGDLDGLGRPRGDRVEHGGVVEHAAIEARQRCVRPDRRHAGGEGGEQAVPVLDLHDVVVGQAERPAPLHQLGVGHKGGAGALAWRVVAAAYDARVEEAIAHLGLRRGG